MLEFRPQLVRLPDHYSIGPNKGGSRPPRHRFRACWRERWSTLII